MDKNQIEINVKGKQYTAYLQGGFYKLKSITLGIHKHNYTEVHVLHGGYADFMVGNESVRVMGGSAIAFAPGVLHCCKYMDKESMCSVYQTDCETDKTRVLELGSEVTSCFVREASEVRKHQNYSNIGSYISFISSLYTEGNLKAEPIRDYGLLIYEFFSKRYNEDIDLQTLAQELRISPRQTVRALMKYKGVGFREALAEARMIVARELIKTTEMSLSEIALYVGYRSYSGFYKAAKKYGLLD